MRNIRLLIGGTIGYFLASIFNSILVVLKETNEEIHHWLANVFGHHWIGHGLLTLLVFVGFTLIFSYNYTGSDLSDSLATKLITIIIIATILSMAIITGFFVAHF